MRRVLILVLLFTMYCIGCKDEPTPPEEKPEGFQEDIPWPSLDSPWPMYQGNPQLTGRSKYAGPQSGEIEWITEVPDSSNGMTDDFLPPVLTKDSLIYILTFRNKEQPSPALKIFDFKGVLKNTISIGGKRDDITSPLLITTDGTMYIPKYHEDTLIALNSAFGVQWKKNIGVRIPGQMNISKDGDLYALGQNGLLLCITSSGEIKWSLLLPDGLGSTDSRISIVPDGETIYVTGMYLYAVSRTGVLKWEYKTDNVLTYCSPLIDNTGNIYIFESSKGGVICLTPEKIVRYFYYTGFEVRSDMTMDRNGNLYFGCGDSVYSLDYNGQIRWKQKADISGFSSSFISDYNGNIYFISNHEKLLYSFSSMGEFRFSIKLNGLCYLSPCISREGRIYFMTFGEKRFLYSIK